MRNPLFPEGSIFAEIELLEGAKTSDGVFLLIIALKPYLLIRIVIGKGLKERRGAFTMEINGTVNTCNVTKG